MREIYIQTLHFAIKYIKNDKILHMWQILSFSQWNINWTSLPPRLCINSCCQVPAAGSSSGFIVLHDIQDELCVVLKTHNNISWEKHSSSFFLRLLFSTFSPATQVISYVSVWVMVCTNYVAVPEINAHRKSSLSTEDNSEKQGQKLTGFFWVLTYVQFLAKKLGLRLTSDSSKGLHRFVSSSFNSGLACISNVSLCLYNLYWVCFQSVLLKKYK